MELKTCERVCKECPFAKTSMRGWLGGLTVEETLDAQQFEQLFSCHLHRESEPVVNLNKIMRGEQPICRGFMISDNNVLSSLNFLPSSCSCNFKKLIPE